MSAILSPEPGQASASPPAPRREGLLLVLAVNVVLLAILFGDRFVRLVADWRADPNYSHGFLVPLLSGWLAWRYFRQAPRPVQGELLLGIATTLSGCVSHLAAIVIDGPLCDFLALGLILRGLAVCAGGRAWARGFTFSILFLFFMFPLPEVWTGAVAVQLQDWVARSSAAVLDLFTVCYRQGTALHLVGLSQPLIVAAECSGLRQIVAFVALGALIGKLGKLPWQSFLLLVLAAIPVALVANVARVLLMAVGALQFGTGWFSGWLHDAPALVTLPFGLALFALVAWALGRVWPSSFGEGTSCVQAKG